MAGSWRSGTMRPHDGVLVLTLAGAGLSALPSAAAPPKCFGKKATISTETDVFGAPGNDVIVGSDGTNAIFGGGGDDLICGLGGTDILLGEAGADKISGGHRRRHYQRRLRKRPHQWRPGE